MDTKEQKMDMEIERTNDAVIIKMSGHEVARIYAQSFSNEKDTRRPTHPAHPCSHRIVIEMDIMGDRVTDVIMSILRFQALQQHNLPTCIKMWS